MTHLKYQGSSPFLCEPIFGSRTRRTDSPIIQFQQRVGLFYRGKQESLPQLQSMKLSKILLAFCCFTRN